MSEKLWIKAKQIFTENGILQNGWVGIENGLIVSVNTTKPSTITDNGSVYDFPNLNLLPGLIDLHVHGCNGVDVMDATEQALNKLSIALASRGVTGFLATTVTTDWEHNLKTFRLIGENCNKTQPGAKLCGAYSEGVFLSPVMAGAHASEFFLNPTISKIEELWEASQHQLKMLAIAPELQGAFEAIEWLTQKGVRVMIGHSNANYEQCQKAFNLGAKGVVHLYNRMTPLHHRDPGIVGSALTKKVLAEIIADGIHVHPDAMKIAYKMKGDDYLALITDCMRAGGLADGDYLLGKLTIQVKDGVARTVQGALAGSVLGLNQAIKNMISMVGVTPFSAVKMASRTPAQFLGIYDKVGSITVGKQADMTLVDDDYQVKMTWVNGQLVYKN